LPDIISYIYIYISGWWFGTFIIFPYIGNNNPNGLSYFKQRGRYTNNRIYDIHPTFGTPSQNGHTKAYETGQMTKLPSKRRQAMNFLWQR